MRNAESNDRPIIVTALSDKKNPDLMNLEFCSSGGYIVGEEREFVNDLIKLGKPLTAWSLWVDIDGHKRPEKYTMAALKKLVENNELTFLKVMARRADGRRFPVPRLKITPKDKPARAAASNRMRLR
jgi:hypothetical protein